MPDNAGIKSVQCVFWKNLPYIDIYRSITPDILHQLYQGLLKHLIGWIRAVCGDAEIGARCCRLPLNHHIRLFMKGISHLSRITGTEHDQISRFLLALVADVHLLDGHSNARLVCTVLDFIYLARYPIHTSETLAQMNNALHAFHLNHDILVSFSIRTHFNIPKLYNSGHYFKLIQLFGTANNFNTEFTEHLHIDLAKDAYASPNFRWIPTNDMLAWPKRACDAPQEVHLSPPRNIFQHASSCPKTSSFFDPQTQAADGEAPNPLRCSYWGDLH